MARPAQLTAVAVFVLICSGIVLSSGILALAIPIPGASRDISILMTVASACGLMTGTGILRRWRWARISVLMFSGFIAYVGSNLSPFLLFMRAPGPPGETETERVILCIFCLALMAVGIWWASLFSNKSTKAMFGVPIPANSTPFSITVIAWSLVVSAATGAFLRMRSNAAPTMTFGFVLTGWSAMVISICFIAINLYLGLSLLLRKRYSIRLVAYWCVFGLLDTTIFFLRPGRDARVNLFYNAQVIRNPGLDAHFSANSWLHFVVLGTFEGAAFTLLALWFLAIHKNVFAVAQGRDDTAGP